MRSAREEFEALALLYRAQIRSPFFTVQALETAIPRGAEQWMPKPKRQLPFLARWRWFRFPVLRRHGFLSAGAFCVQDPGSVVQLIDGLRPSIELVADINVFVTIYDGDGYRVDMQYVRRGVVLRVPAGCGSTYILNVSIGATDPGGAGVALTSSGAEA